MEKKIESKESKKEIVFEEIKGRPQVLLVGNGIDRLFGTEDWNRLLNRGFENFNIQDEDVLNEMPMPVKFEAYTATASAGAVKQKLETLLRDINNEAKTRYARSQEYQAMLKELLLLNSDAILTTNYTKSLEFCAESVGEFKKSQKKASKDKYFHSFKEMKIAENKRRVYYTHGIMDDLNSVVLSQKSYDEQLYNTLEKFSYYSPSKFLASVNNAILTQEEIERTGKKHIKEDNFKGYICNWTDLFRVADIYILGFGMDFAEQDFWALFRQWKNIGKCDKRGQIFCYAPQISKSRENLKEYLQYRAKKQLIENIGAEWETLGMCKQRDTDSEKFYRDFYVRAIQDIREKMNERRITLAEETLTCRFVIDNN